jgi:hypothetical protein
VSPTELAALGELAKNITVIVLLLIIVYGGQKEWWVYGREYRRIIKELEEWRELALTNLGVADKAVGGAKVALDLATRQRSARPARKGRYEDDESDPDA